MRTPVVDLACETSSDDDEVELLETVKQRFNEKSSKTAHHDASSSDDDDEVQIVEPPRKKPATNHRNQEVAVSDSRDKSGSTLKQQQSSILARLSIPDLKRQLTARGIPFHDCIEKRDLVERLLQNTNSTSHQNDHTTNQKSASRGATAAAAAAAVVVAATTTAAAAATGDDPFGPLADGETVTFSKYTIKRTGQTYYCTCPAWKFQRKPPADRTCKHIDQLRAESCCPLSHVGGRGHQDHASAAGAAGSSSNKKKHASATSPSRASKSSKKPNAGKDDSSDDMIQVTLAEKWNPDKQEPTGYYLSEKLDGMRCVWDGPRGILLSRNGNVISAPNFFVNALPRDICLDGELFLGRQKFQELMSVKSNPNDPRWSQVSLVVFDVPNMTNCSTKHFSTRLEVARKALRHVPTKICRVLEQTVCTGPAHVYEQLESITAQGGEGVMLRNPAAPYESGRSKNLLKVKRTLDAEAVVVGYEEGKGKHQGRLGALKCEMIPDHNKTFKIGTGFNDLQRQMRPAIGSIVTYKYQELTKAGLPRFPVFVRVRPPE